MSQIHLGQEASQYDDERSDGRSSRRTKSRGDYRQDDYSDEEEEDYYYGRRESNSRAPVPYDERSAPPNTNRGALSTNVRSNAVSRSRYDDYDDYDDYYDERDYQRPREQPRSRKTRDQKEDRSRSKSQNKFYEALHDNFDDSGQGLLVGGVGALAGGYLGKKYGKSPIATGAGAVIGALGANALEARGNKDHKQKDKERGHSHRRSRSEDAGRGSSKNYGDDYYQNRGYYNDKQIDNGRAGYNDSYGSPAGGRRQSTRERMKARGKQMVPFANPQDPYGEPVYYPEDFGLDGLDENFRDEEQIRKKEEKKERRRERERQQWHQERQDAFAWKPHLTDSIDEIGGRLIG